MRGDVGLPPREKVVHAEDFVAFAEKSLAEMGAEETGAAGDENAHKPRN
jgi:hypothetical protein